MVGSLPRDLEKASAADRQAIARRRAQAAAEGFTGDPQGARSYLKDPHPAVRSAGLSALCRLDACRPAEARRALADPSPWVRRSACELARSLPRTTGVGAAIRALLMDSDPSVIEAACFAVGERSDRAACSTLDAIARGHDDPLCREAAVAALGAIGSAKGRAAILAALDDLPAVRRRAVVALAAFEGPEVDAALKARLTDRDWQVRQAAEDVLGA